jgi:membrane protein YdbS with pleckstrin-like domain
VTPDRPLAALLTAWAIVDLLQVPLVLTVFVTFRLARRFGAAWRSAAVCFGGYAGWVLLTSRVVPYSPSGLLVLLFGLVLDPRRDTPPERTWALGAAVAVALFWVLPVALAWRFRRARRPARR